MSILVRSFVESEFLRGFWKGSYEVVLVIDESGGKWREWQWRI